MQVKRPLVWGILFFLLGIWLCSYSVYLIIFMTVFICLAMFWLSRHYKWQGFFVMPILFLIGAVHLLSYEYDYKQVSRNFTEGDTYVEATLLSIDTYYEDNRAKCTMRLESIEDQRMKGQSRYFICYMNDGTSISPGFTYKVYGDLRLPSPSRNPGSFDEANYYLSEGLVFKIYAKDIEVIEERWKVFSNLYKIKASLSQSFDTILPKEESAFIKTMLLGSSFEAGGDYYDTFRELGIVHVLAISGLHITLIFYVCFNILKKIGLRNHNAYVITLFFILLYGLMTGFSVSTIRAFIMFTVIVLGQVLGRKGDIYTSIAIAALIMLIINPFSIYQIGFQLSFLALLGILLVTQVLGIYIKKKTKFLSLINASIGAFLITWPVIAYHFYYVSLYGLFMNLLIIPIMGLLIIMSFLSGIVAMIWVDLGTFLIGGVYYIIRFIKIIGDGLKCFPFGYVLLGRPSIVLIVGYYLLVAFILFIMYKKSYKRYLKMGTVLCFIIGVLLLISPRGHQVTFLDVGQGDSAIIQTVSDNTFIIDGGKENGSKIIKNYLDYKGIDKVDGIFVTHTDSDHIGGIIPLLDEIKADRIFLAKQLIQDNTLRTDLIQQAEENQVSIIYLEDGDYLSNNDIEIEVLAPKSSLTYPTNNDSSLVLSIMMDNIDILFTGDIEKFGEDKLLEEPLKAYDVLKVPHHGSNSSSTQDFIDVVSPQIGIISCGEKNKYGHPHEEVVKRLERKGIILYNTSTDGAILMQVNQDNIKLKKWLRDVQW